MKTKKIILYLLTVIVTLSLSLGVKLGFSYINLLSSGSFEIIDFYNAVEEKLYSNQTFSCNDVVIIDIDGCGIEKLPDVIEEIDSYSPQVIGLDIIFYKHNDDIDNRLRKVILDCDNIVVANEYRSTTHQVDSSPIFKNTNIPEAAVNLEDPIVRHYYPQFILKDRINSFALELVKQYRPEKYKEQLKRGSKKNLSKVYDFSEPIHIYNFSCRTISYTELLDDGALNNDSIKNILRNKIIIVGTCNVCDDLHYVSGNNSMSGAIIHAAIIRTILNDDYTEEYPWLNDLLAILITAGFVWLFIILRKKYSTSGNLIIRGLQIFLLLVSVLSGTILYIYENLYIDLTITLLSVGLIYVGYDIVFGINNIVENIQKKHNNR